MQKQLETHSPSPWHQGEKRLQQSVGVAERMEAFGRRVIRDFMPEQHRAFYQQLPFIVAGVVDETGDAWATILAGAPGFISSPDETTLEISEATFPGDPALGGFGDNAAIGLLGIELHTRRRNRLNGTISRRSDRATAVKVGHSFGNCPQYIQLREFELTRDPAIAPQGAAEVLSSLDQEARDTIAGADTFFVASYVDLAAGRQADVSHRGGKAGFVRIADDGMLTIPDYAGNLHFNTLGNFLEISRAGLIFADFETGDVLQLTGRAEVILNSPEIAAFQGTERLWNFRPTGIVRRKGALPLRWAFREWSPNSLMTGSWEEAEARLAGERLRAAWRPMRIAKIVDESRVIRSFHLEPADGAGIVAHLAGQHLPIRVAAGPNGEIALRTYTISTAPSDGRFRISVKREGLVSKFLHDKALQGDIIEARAPQGTFTVDASERRPVALISGGVGVTPMLAMLRHIVYEGLRTRRVRSTYFFQAARVIEERAFDGEIDSLADQAQGAVRIIRVLNEEPADASRKPDHIGFIDMQVLKAHLPFDDFDFYMCGPPGFMQSIYDGLRGLNVADSRIHAESFGPASLKRSGAFVDDAPAAAPATHSVPVAFIKSGKEARWSPDAGTLLALAEARGLDPAYSCRVGKCGTCRTRIIEGAVAYTVIPSAEVSESEALICCAVPADKDSGGGDRLILDL